jgi:RNA polymerase sigma factor for flagellar operon FliA
MQTAAAADEALCVATAQGLAGPAGAAVSDTTSLSQDVQDLVAQSLPLVRSVVAGLAANYPRHCDRDELVAAGTLGLVEAARRFDPARGVPFERWAVLRIRGAVVDAVRALDFAPRSLRSTARDRNAVCEVLEAELGRTPTSAEVADRMGITLPELVALEGRLHRSTVLSLDAPAADADDTTLASIVVHTAGDPLEELERRERDNYVHDAIDLLPERMRAVVVGYFLEGLTSGELADQLGVTESRVSQLRSEALAMMRAGLEAQLAEAPAPVEPAVGRVAAKQASYNASLASQSGFAARLAVRVPAPRRAADDLVLLAS